MLRQFAVTAMIIPAAAEGNGILLPSATNVLIIDNEIGKLELYVVSIHAA